MQTWAPRHISAEELPLWVLPKPELGCSCAGHRPYLTTGTAAVSAHHTFAPGSECNR